MKNSLLKKHLILFLILIFSPLIIYNFYNPQPVKQLTPPAPQTDQFLFGAMHSWQDATDNYADYESIGLNFWHSYTYDDEQIPGRHSPMGRMLLYEDRLMTPVSTYAQKLKDSIDMLYSHNYSKLLWERPKIEWLLFGQSSIYEAEPIPLSDDKWFYSFNYHDVGAPEVDQQYAGGNTVMHCDPLMDNIPRNVVWSLKANTEQCRRENNWVGDSECEWLIKPKIRIDSAFANNPLNKEIPVCRIKVKNQIGNDFKSVVLKVKNFLDNNDQYDGKYLEEYRKYSGDSSLQYTGTWAVNDTGWGFKARGSLYTPDEENSPWIENHADIQVYWYANCDMWIDYVKVENDIADELLNPNNPNHERDLLWIKDEVEIAMHIPPGASEPAVWKFYVELFEFNNVPCMAYVNHIIDSLSFGKIGLMADFTANAGNHLRWYQHKQFFEPERLLRTVVQKIGFKHFYAESYPMTGIYETTPVNTFSRIPNTLPNSTPGNNVLALPVSPLIYDEWLQNNLDQTPYEMDKGEGPGIYQGSFDRSPRSPCPVRPQSQDAGNYRWVMKIGDYMSKHGVPFIHMPQSHLWFFPWEVRREPTNEELDMLANIPITYGAKGLMYFWYATELFPDACLKYGIGMEEFDKTLREQNAYQQTKFKWHQFRDIGIRMKAWEPYIMSFDDANRHSYINRLERSNLLSQTYFNDVISYVRGNDLPICDLDAPDTTDAPTPPNLRYECFEDRYLQTATFNMIPGTRVQYFMIVNRRCSPLQSLTHDDGERYIRVMLDQNSNYFQNFNSWNIVDAEFNTLVGSFDKTSVNPCVDLKWFKPGEGKLYKIVPTAIGGGILAGDENISGESFTCEAPVYNNGHNITIGANTTIHFTDSAKFVMDGGVFTVGDQNISAPQNITSDAVTGSSWSGHSFTNCEVKIYGATFTGLANDTTYAVNIIDCPVVDIRNCTFTTNSSLKGGVNAVFFSDPNNEITLSNIYIGANTFNSSGSTIPTINISSYAGETTPLIIENNTFNEGNTAIFLSGITGGAIKGNSITDNFIGINALTSAIDIKSNTISSTINSAIGIFAAGSSELKMNNAGSKSLGGLNDLSNSGNTAANNIVVDGSVFLLDGGQNIFNITDDQSSKHLYGYFPQFTQGPFDETNNCFKLNSTPIDPPYNVVTSGFQGSQITFNFTPYLSGCEANDGGDGFAINLGDGIYDTIYNGGSGSGGSMKEALPLNKGEYPKGEGVYYKQAQIPPRRDFETASQFLGRGALLLSTPKQIYDSISVLMRYRNYTQAKTKCLDLIITYPDSIQSLNAISKLFLSTVASDTSYNAVNELKIYYEDLILNHGYNTSLVKRANYYILKCKVRMRQYTQALAGFQQIINQNPYSYEGLIARWDYMATSLLIQGQSGGFPTLKLRELHSLELREVESYDPDDLSDEASAQSDRSPFTKEQRQDIRKSINTAIEISKDEDDRKIKTLEVKSEQGDVNASKELEQIRSLKQVVKTEKPKSIIEHVRIVSEDIRQVFGSNTSGKGNEPKNIPLVFRLSQNYPNPFNPVTKINYDLPRDSKVNIVIYDILGREVKRLVNNELKTAGSYIVDFNASNYASGVYFYRIEAEEPNGNKFVDSKKMVLIK